MPSLTHEGLVLIFRHAPALAAQLVQDVLHAPLPRFDHARIGKTDLSQPLPTTFTADLVIVLEREQKAAGAILVEPQLRPRPDKRRTWPHYLTGLRAELNCAVILLVIAVDERVARWAAAPIEIGHPGFCLTPLVLGPKDIPRIVDRTEAIRTPELAVLSVMAHARKESPDRALEMAKAALIACDGLQVDRALPYCELVLQSLDRVAQAALEKLMASGQFQYRSPFARKFLGEGLAKGRAQGKAHSVLTVLRARRLTITDEQKTRILACTEMKQLDRWLKRALSISSVRQLFVD